MPFLSCSYAAATYQPKLKDCNGADLPAGTEMATCADLAGLSIADATDTTKGKVALNAGTSLPGDATNCTDALTACGLNALLADATVGGNAVINGVKALIPLATTTVAGLIEEATGEETRLGATDANRADRAVTPESMSYALQGYRVYPIITFDSSVTTGTALGKNIRMRSTADGTAIQTARFEMEGGTVGTGAPGFCSAIMGFVSPSVTLPAGTLAQAISGESKAIGAGTNIGVYGTAANGATNWAGYFDGNTYLGTLSGVGTTNLVNLGAGRSVTTMDGATDSIIWGRAGGADTGYLQFRAGGVNLNSLGSNSISLDAGTSGEINFLTAGNFRLKINAAGASVFGGSVTATSYITSSDSTLKENVEAIDAAKALQFRNGLQWKKYELFSEQQVEITEEVTEEVQKTDAEGNPVVDADGNPVMETLTKQVGTGRYEVKRNSLGIKRGLIAQEVLALAQSIGDFTDVVVEVGEYFTLDAQGYPVKDAQGNNIVNKRLGLDYDAVQFIICAGEQSLLPAVV